MGLAGNSQINRVASSGAACKRSAKENNNGTAIAQHNLHAQTTTTGFHDQHMKNKLLSSMSGGGHGVSGKTSHKVLSNRNQSFNTANSSNRINAVNHPALITSQNHRDGPSGNASALSSNAAISQHMH